MEFPLLCLLKQMGHSSPVVLDLPSTMCYGSRRDELLQLWRPSFKLDQYTVQETMAFSGTGVVREQGGGSKGK